MSNIGKKYLGIDIKECKFLGKGCEGKVYLTPDGYALKIFKCKAKCKEEYEILKKVEGSKYFPKIINSSNRCILREYVPGEMIKDYIIKNGLSEQLAINLINLIEEFKRLSFKRQDIRGEHIYVQNDESIMVIDPRKSYTKKVSIPISIIKDLEKVGVIDKFVKVLVGKRLDLACLWVSAINK